MLSFVSNYIQYIFLLYHISKTYVIEKYVALSFCLKPMFFCLTQKPHPVRRPPLCRRGAGGEAVPRQRENQINTLVLKDINFTINIIDCLITERLIPWINLKCSRGIKQAPLKESLPKPLQRRGCPYCIQFEIAIYMSGLRDIPSFGGAWVGFFCDTYPN